MPTVGLTLGKFAPLHAGHQRMIETSLVETDQTVVLIYDCPEVTDIPLNVRANWLRTLYPQITVIEAWEGPTETGEDPEVCRTQEEYALSLLRQHEIAPITHFYSSEFYGDHMSKALSAIDRRLDSNRITIPISGTAIRNNPFEYRRFLDPRVYRDLITNVLFIGAPSTGKSTLCERLAEELNTVWMPEYGREYWAEHQQDRRLEPSQLTEIARGHLEREEKLLYESNRYLITDTNALTTYLFALEYHGFAEPELAELAYRSASRYDVVLLCDTDIPYDDTWDRSGDVQRQRMQKRFYGELHARKIPYYLVRGNLEERVEQVEEILRGFRKFANAIS